MAEDEQELWLGELLDAAAEQYQPDAERLKAMITARIAQQSEEAEATTTDGAPAQRAARRKAAKGRSRLGLIGRLGLAGIPAGVALSTIGAAAALAVGATATIAVTSSHGHPTVAVAAPSSTPGHGGASSQGPGESGSPSSTGGSTHPATSGASGSVGASGDASSSGDTTSSTLVAATPSIDKSSNADWSQLDLTVDVKEPLTALHVTVKVSKCDGLASTGSWDSGASGQFTEVTTTDSGGSITYEFELVQGDEVSPGSVTFAVQFNHAATGWNVADDTYYVSARTTTSTSASSVQGAYQG